MARYITIVSFSFLVSVSLSCAADTVLRVAVASNFLATAKTLGMDFSAQKPSVSVQLMSGSTGKLYAQITHGAPYDIFLSADTAAPTALSRSSLAEASSQFTYAEGVLVLAGRSVGEAPSAAVFTSLPKDKKIALAQPALAPYGRAASEALHAMTVDKSAASQLVYGENVLQAQQFLASGVVDYAFIAQPLVGVFPFWVIPEHYYASIQQDAVLLTRSASSQTARQFMRYLRSVRAKNIIEKAGYRVVTNKLSSTQVSGVKL